MAKINLGNVEQYKPEGTFDFFNLKDDGDVAEVRFLYETLDDLDIRNVHKLELKSGKTMYVDCLRDDYESSMDLCPCCADGNKASLQVWIPLYDVREEKAMLWNRGYGFITGVLLPTLTDVAEKNGKDGLPICATHFIIERHGVAGDSKTTYTVEPVETDDFMIDDLGEDFVIPTAIGKILHEKTAAELSSFVKNGYFGNSGGSSGARRGTGYSGSDDASVKDILTRRRGTRPNNM